MNSWKSLFLLLLLFCLPLTVSAAPDIPTGLQVTGAVITPADWQPLLLRQRFKSSLQAITYTSKGVKHTAYAVPLWAVLQAAQPRVNPQIKNHQLQFIVLVRGRDGYTAAFSLPELSPDFGDRPAWLALDEDGKPLGEDAGPFALIVPEDKKAGRWVHAVVAITVRDEEQATASGGA